ncbi:hypothetical protein [Pseudarthrobacter sp. H2]|uniref:hypothetical protein n=1 Tax=Pseudarthrobacter sp. H2 TaxID=3418415 RepID=UPI003CF3DD69
MSGQTVSYANDATRQPKLASISSDLAVINFSHNEQNNVSYRAGYEQLADALVAKWPDLGIIATTEATRVPGDPDRTSTAG